jgi:hypothetical protein
VALSQRKTFPRIETLLRIANALDCELAVEFRLALSDRRRRASPHR